MTLDPAHLEALAGSVPAAELPGIYRAFAVDLARLAAELLAHVAAGDAAEARLAAHALAGAAAGIGAAIKATLAAHGLKMPQLAMPVRVLVMGTPQTPSLDAVLALHRREDVLARLAV